VVPTHHDRQPYVDIPPSRPRGPLDIDACSSSTDDDPTLPSLIFSAFAFARGIGASLGRALDFEADGGLTCERPPWPPTGNIASGRSRFFLPAFDSSYPNLPLLPHLPSRPHRELAPQVGPVSGRHRQLRPAPLRSPAAVLRSVPPCVRDRKTTQADDCGRNLRGHAGRWHHLRRRLPPQETLNDAARVPHPLLRLRDWTSSGDILRDSHKHGS